MPSILLIEDDMDLRETLLDLLKIEGFQVQSARDGEGRPGGRERRPALVPDEKRASEQPLESVNPGTDRGLSHVQPFRRAYETAVRDDLQKSPGELDVHVPISMNIAFNCQSVSERCDGPNSRVLP